MVDLAHRRAERSQPGFLAQGLANLALHGRKFPLRRADLVAPLGRQHHAGRIFRLLTKSHHVFRDTHHRHHQRPVERKEHQRCGEDGNDDRQEQDIAGIDEHRLPQRRVVDHDLDELTAAKSRAAGHGHRAAAPENQGLEGVVTQFQPRGATQIITCDDHVLHGAGQEQFTPVVTLERDRLHLCIAQQFSF